MPQIPVYQPRVREQALDGGTLRAPDVSSGLQAVAKGLGDVSAAATQIVERDDRAAADAADAEITGAWLQWDAENRAKYRGQNAGAYQAEAQGWWRKAAETYGTKLSPRARELVSGTLLRKQTSALADVTRHVGAEKERFADESAMAAITTTAQMGVTTGDVAGAALQIRKQVADIGARKGWDTAMVQAEQQKQLGQMHLAHISKLAETNAAAAQAYYQSVKGEVPAANQPRVEAVLKNEEDNQFAAQFSAERAGKPLEQTLQDASGITDPQRREKVITRIKQDHALVREAQREREEKAADTAWQLFAQGKKIPEAVLAGMDGRGRVQLQEAQRARAERALAGKPVKTDWNTYIDLRERIAAGEKITLQAYTEKIGPAQMEQLLDIQTARRATGARQDSMMTDHQRIEAAITGLGLDVKKNKEHAAQAGMLTAEIDRRVRAASAAKGDKQLTPDEKQAIVDGVVLDKVYVDTWGRDEQRPVVTLTPDEQKSAYVSVGGRNVLVSSVPQQDRMQIIEALRAVGRPVTEQAVVELYLRGKTNTEAKREAQRQSAVNQIPR